MVALFRKFGSIFGSSDNKSPAKGLSLQRAVSDLLFEASRVDDDVTLDDTAIAKKTLVDLLKVSESDADRLFAESCLVENRIISYQPLTNLINKSLTYEDKTALIRAMWNIAHSDGSIHSFEDHIVRKIADLLYVSHTDFIYAKNLARNERNS